MNQTENNILWAISKLNLLSGMDGFPRTELGLRGIAMAVLSILDDQPACYSNRYDEEKHCGVDVMTRAAISAPDTFDWLIQQILSGCERFPMPIVMRRFYEAGQFRCADRKLSGEFPS